MKKKSNKQKNKHKKVKKIQDNATLINVVISFLAIIFEDDNMLNISDFLYQFGEFELIFVISLIILNIIILKRLQKNKD